MEIEITNRKTTRNGLQLGSVDFTIVALRKKRFIGGEISWRDGVGV